jgi:hypothetical protein
MIKRFNQAVTFSLLVFFTTESILPAIDSDAGKFSTVDRLSTPTDHCSVFSWILEETETEECDSKTHGDQIFCVVSSFHARGYEVLPFLPQEIVLYRNQKLLKLIHLLRI